MKKTGLFIAILLFCCSLLVSCGLMLGQVAESGSVTVVVDNGDGDYQVYLCSLDLIENKDEGAKGILEHLRDREKDPLTLAMTESTYGAYVSGIGAIKESPRDGEYVMVYSSVAADSYEGAPTVEYEGITLYQSGVGLSSMSVDEGTFILFRLEGSPF